MNEEPTPLWATILYRCPRCLDVRLDIGSKIIDGSNEEYNEVIDEYNMLANQGLKSLAKVALGIGLLVALGSSSSK